MLFNEKSHAKSIKIGLELSCSISPSLSIRILMKKFNQNSSGALLLDFLCFFVSMRNLMKNQSNLFGALLFDFCCNLIRNLMNNQSKLYQNWSGGLLLDFVVFRIRDLMEKSIKISLEPFYWISVVF